jgi:hypothetical protein
MNPGRPDYSSLLKMGTMFWEVPSFLLNIYLMVRLLVMNGTEVYFDFVLEPALGCA